MEEIIKHEELKTFKDFFSMKNHLEIDHYTLHKIKKEAIKRAKYFISSASDFEAYDEFISFFKITEEDLENKENLTSEIKIMKERIINVNRNLTNITIASPLIFSGLETTADSDTEECEVTTFSISAVLNLCPATLIISSALPKILNSFPFLKAFSTS